MRRYGISRPVAIGIILLNALALGAQAALFNRGQGSILYLALHLFFIAYFYRVYRRSV